MNNVVSVIIPTYNRAAFLNEAIQSVLLQNYRPIECIIVDDGSTDNTKEVVEKLKNIPDSGLVLKYIYQNNTGSQAARNNGTKAATGTFIQYLDSDDLLYSDKLEQQVNYLKEHKDCDALFGDWEIEMQENKKLIKALPSDNFLYHFFIERPVAIFSMLMRKELIEKIGDWDITIKRNQEIDFHLRGVLAGGNFEYQPVLCGLWRIHNAERIGNASKLSDAIAFYQKWENILRQKKLWNTELSVGVVKNYVWFLGTYSHGEVKEINKLLKEMYRLHPAHSLFVNPKFKIVKKILGLNMAINLWITRYKRNLYKVNG